MQQGNSSNDGGEFLGITQNECTFQGVVQGDPTIFNENFARLILRTTISEQGANGQWNDIPVDVPIMTTEPGKVSSINQYIKDGRKLLIYAYYRSWMDQGALQHGFFIKKMVFGPKKWEPKSNAGPSAPSLPTN